MVDREELAREAAQVQMWLTGQNDGVTYQGSFPEAGTEWYLLSTQWLSLWKQYVGLEAITNLPLGANPLRPISNEDLIQDPDSDPGYLRSVHDNSIYDFPIKRNLEAQRDFLVLPKVAWDFLVNQYGLDVNSELKRFSRTVTDEETQVEVNFRPVLVAFVPPFNREIRIPKAKTVYFSRSEPLDKVSKRLKIIYNNKHPSISVAGTRMWKLTPGVSETDLEKIINDASGRFKLFPGEELDECLNIDEAEFSFTDTLVFEAKRTTSDWTFTAFQDVFCSRCRAKIGRSGLKCLCEKVFFCNETCRDLSGHYCPHFTPSSNQKKCPFCNSTLPVHCYTCNCGKVRTNQFSYCEQLCMQRHSHVCPKGDYAGKCRYCQTTLPGNPVVNGTYKYCSVTCKNSDLQTNADNVKKCHTCTKTIGNGGYQCKCGKVTATQYDYCTESCYNSDVHSCLVKRTCPQCSREVTHFNYPCPCRKVTVHVVRVLLQCVLPAT